MQDTSIERLSKIIGDPRQMPGGLQDKRPSRTRALFSHIHLGLAEGWFSLFLLILVVYSGIWSVEAAGWVENLGILTLTTALGLAIGVIAAKQRRWPRLVVHPLAIIFGILLAFWQTAGADKNGSLLALVDSIHQWIALALNGGTSNDDSIFLFLIIALGFLLAYTSAWLLYRTRSPWLMIAANAVVLLINLSNIDPGYIVFLVLFLVAALLLLLRFNLFESSVRWKRMGLRTSDDLGWEFMQAGAMISLGILIAAWLLPSGYINDAAAQIWTIDNNPWTIVQNEWNRLISVTDGYNPQNHGNFTSTLTLGGNPNLTDAIVFKVITDDTTQYLETLSYDSYDGRSWSNEPSQSFTLKPGEPYSDSSADLVAVQQQIQVVNPPGEEYPYLLGPQLASTDQPVAVLYRKSDGSVITLLRTKGNLAAGDTYSVTSYVSGADVPSLEAIPLPKDAPSFTPDPNLPDLTPPPGYYDPAIVQTYTQLPPNLDPRIKALATQITSGSKSMYDMATALESYLRNHYTYDTNINLPPGAEGVSWFLFNSGNRGFCNYFATAMAVMARELGMPARVVAGYTNGNGTPDPKTHELTIQGSDAHAWTQIYFAQYGWVNFEPSSAGSFPTFARPIHSFTSPPGTLPGGGGSTSGTNPKRRNPGSLPDDTGTGQVLSGSSDIGGQVRMDIGIALLALVALIVGGLLYFNLWWRRLFRGYGLSTEIFGRISMLANWAGIAPRLSQTPFEYKQTLSESVPDSAATIERLSDIYVRDRWADPAGAEHPRRTGEVNQLPGLWRTLQPRLFLYALRHPHFLRKVPNSISAFFSKRRARHKRYGNDDGLLL